MTNPMASLVSSFEYAQRVRFEHFDCGRTWDGPLRRPPATRMNGDPRWPAWRFADPADDRNAFCANAFPISTEHPFVRDCEALLRDGEAVLAALDAALAAPQRRASPDAAAAEPPVRAVSCGGDARVGVVLDEQPFERRTWVLEREWLDRYDAQPLRRLANRIDPRRLRSAGYRGADVRRAARTGSDAGSMRS